MPTRAAYALLPLLLLAAAPAATPVRQQEPGTVCPDPERPCPGFKPHHLSFVLPGDSVARAEFRSDPFFAIILKRGPRCEITEEERTAAQALFPRNKVFSQRFDCGDAEENVTYANVNPAAALMAVYAGETQGQALAFLETVRATGRFPEARIRRTQVVLIYP